MNVFVILLSNAPDASPITSIVPSIPNGLNYVSVEVWKLCQVYCVGNCASILSVSPSVMLEL